MVIPPRILQEKISSDLLIQKALSLAQKNTSSGRLWLIGGQVYRTIIEFLYGIPEKECVDVDIIVELLNTYDKLFVPQGWALTQTSAGSPRFKYRNIQIDLIPLDKAVHPDDIPRVSNLSSDEKILSYLRRTPLNVQSIIYDLVSQKIIGDIGIAAIETQTVAVNCEEKCVNYCSRHNLSVEEFVTQKAIELGFSAKL